MNHAQYDRALWRLLESLTDGEPVVECLLVCGPPPRPTEQEQYGLSAGVLVLRWDVEVVDWLRDRHGLKNMAQCRRAADLLRRKIEGLQPL